MLLLRYTKLFLLDCRKSIWKIVLCYAILVFGVITFSNYANFLDDPKSIPDVFNYLFIKGSFFTLTIPLFLFFLSLVLLPMFDPLRLVRFQDRSKLATIILFTVFLVVILFLSAYFISGFLYGWLKSGSIDNPWATKEGKPFIMSEGEVDLSLFSTGYMILRYTVTEFFAFLFIGLFAALLYLFLPRYIYVFIIVEGFVIFDLVLSSLFNFTLFFGKAVVNLDNWGDVSFFIGNILYFLGLVIVFIIGIYVVVSRKEFIPVIEEKE